MYVTVLDGVSVRILEIPDYPSDVQVQFYLQTHGFNINRIKYMVTVSLPSLYLGDEIEI